MENKHKQHSWIYNKDEVSPSDAYLHSLTQGRFKCGRNVPVKECKKRMVVWIQYMVTGAYHLLLHSHSFLNPTEPAEPECFLSSIKQSR